jgi:hypothetical protein
MRKAKIRFVLILMVPLLVNASDGGYHGSGTFNEETRTYVPVIGVTKGYTITMPRFSTEKDTNITYSLAGIPRQNNAFQVEIAVYIPSKRLSLEEARKVDISLPDSHQIHCLLFDVKNKRVLQERTEKVSKLLPSKGLHYQLSPFVKHLLTESFADVPPEAELEIRMEYRTSDEALKREMMIIVVNDAPTA